MSSPAQVLQSAYADLVSRVFLCLRNRVFKDEDQLHELGDALHNISGILGSYGAWIEDQEYRALYLRPYDSRWGTKGLALVLPGRRKAEIQGRADRRRSRRCHRDPE